MILRETHLSHNKTISFIPSTSYSYNNKSWNQPYSYTYSDHTFQYFFLIFLYALFKLLDFRIYMCKSTWNPLQANCRMRAEPSSVAMCLWEPLIDPRFQISFSAFGTRVDKLTSHWRFQLLLQLLSKGTACSCHLGLYSAAAPRASADCC